MLEKLDNIEFRCFVSDENTIFENCGEINLIRNRKIVETLVWSFRSSSTNVTSHWDIFE